MPSPGRQTRRESTAATAGGASRMTFSLPAPAGIEHSLDVLERALGRAAIFLDQFARARTHARRALGFAKHGGPRAAELVRALHLDCAAGRQEFSSHLAEIFHRRAVNGSFAER